MSKQKPNKIQINANPAKAFFVDMLTRDIELGDAILDLLDNCVDGVLRTINDNTKLTKGSPYEGFWAEITFGEDYFIIKDNCGGISKEIAINSAFRFGRADLERDKDLPTVGMYGIGMKRAIFKIGKSCFVKSRHRDEAYEVSITPEWLKKDDDWYLPIKDVPTDHLEIGTIIEVRELHQLIKHEFSPSKSKFIRDFKNTVATHYSYILQKGFKVVVRDSSVSEEVAPKPLALKFAQPKDEQEVITPYLYKGSCNGVDVNLAIGLYREFPTAEEIDDNLDGKSASTEDAGWTIICNDRVVVYNDKTKATGWGEAGVPKYHTQFISIAGIVSFQCNDASKLPVGTTKRGIDGNSETYLTIKNIMREGLKHFTSFTNKWKTPSPERDKLFKDTETVGIFDTFKRLDDSAWAKVSGRQDYKGYRYIPALPSIQGEISMRQIQFSRPSQDIRLVAQLLFDTSDEKPSKVGEECFDYVLEKAKKSL